MRKRWICTHTLKKYFYSAPDFAIVPGQFWQMLEANEKCYFVSTINFILKFCSLNWILFYDFTAGFTGNLCEKIKAVNNTKCPYSDCSKRFDGGQCLVRFCFYFLLLFYNDYILELLLFPHSFLHRLYLDLVLFLFPTSI